MATRFLGFVCLYKKCLRLKTTSGACSRVLVTPATLLPRLFNEQLRGPVRFSQISRGHLRHFRFKFTADRQERFPENLFYLYLLYRTDRVEEFQTARGAVRNSMAAIFFFLQNFSCRSHIYSSYLVFIALRDNFSRCEIKMSERRHVSESVGRYHRSIILQSFYNHHSIIHTMQENR